jgi:hypothetical protein
MNWQQYADALPELPDAPTLEQWRETVAKAKELLVQVDETDRHMARRILGDTLIQTGAFMGYTESPAAP